MCELSPEKIKESQDRLDTNVAYMDSVLSKVVGEYTQYLDEVMDKVYEEVIMIDEPSIITIEKNFALLSRELYKVSEKVEKVGMMNSLAKAQAKETYNNKYLEHQHSNDGEPKAKKPTVAESTAEAEKSAIYDNALADTYDKAYKMIKSKVDSATIMNSTLSKMYSRRIKESEMLQTQMGKMVLNENTGEVF